MLNYQRVPNLCIKCSSSNPWIKGMNTFQPQPSTETRWWLVIVTGRPEKNTRPCLQWPCPCPKKSTKYTKSKHVFLLDSKGTSAENHAETWRSIYFFPHMFPSISGNSHHPVISSISTDPAYCQCNVSCQNCTKDQTSQPKYCGAPLTSYFIDSCGHLIGKAPEVEVLTQHAGWCPPVISWFINPINYSYICHKP